MIRRNYKHHQLRDSNLFLMNRDMTRDIHLLNLHNCFYNANVSYFLTARKLKIIFIRLFCNLFIVRSNFQDHQEDECFKTFFFINFAVDF